MTTMRAWHAHGFKSKCMMQNKFLKIITSELFNELLIYLPLCVLEIDEELYIFF